MNHFHMTIPVQMLFRKNALTTAEVWLPRIQFTTASMLAAAEKSMPLYPFHAPTGTRTLLPALLVKSR